jgi:hypothetical protein
VSDYQGEAAGWEWLFEDELRWQAEKDEASPPADQPVHERMLADFDSIFVNAGE